MSGAKVFTRGLLKDNPTFVQLLGMCPTLAVTTSVANGVGMGLSATAVLVASNIVISLLRRFIPNRIRIASYIVVIAGFVSMIEMLLKAYLPSISKSLGLFIPLIVVNCIILARAEAFASKNTVVKSALDGLGMSLFFSMSFMLIVSGLTCRSFIHFEFIFVCGVKGYSNFILFTCGCPVFPIQNSMEVH